MLEDHRTNLHNCHTDRVEDKHMAGGAPIGNRNAAKPRIWEAAIQRAARPKDLEEIANAVIAAAKNGEAWAVTEIGNRLDGKPVQPVDMKHSSDAPTLTNAYLAHVAAGGKPDEFGREGTLQ